MSASLGISWAVKTSDPSSRNTLRAAADSPNLSVQISNNCEKKPPVTLSCGTYCLAIKIIVILFALLNLKFSHSFNIICKYVPFLNSVRQFYEKFLLIHS